MPAVAVQRQPAQALPRQQVLGQEGQAVVIQLDLAQVACAPSEGLERDGGEASGEAQGQLGEAREGRKGAVLDRRQVLQGVQVEVLHRGEGVAGLQARHGVVAHVQGLQLLQRADGVHGDLRELVGEQP